MSGSTEQQKLTEHWRPNGNNTGPVTNGHSQYHTKNVSNSCIHLSHPLSILSLLFPQENQEQSRSSEFQRQAKGQNGATATASSRVGAEGTLMSYDCTLGCKCPTCECPTLFDVVATCEPYILPSCQITCIPCTECTCGT